MALLMCLQSLTLGARPAAVGSRVAARGQAVSLRGTGCTGAVGRSATLQVEAKQNSKKRVRQAAKARMYNKSKKSEITTRIKKVLAAAAEAKTAGGEAAMATVEALLSEAYKTIDMAASKGILKKNTAARRKSLVARARDAAAAPATA